MDAFTLFFGGGMSVPSKQEMLEAVENAIHARMTGGAVASYAIGGRNLQYISLRDLMDLKVQLQREIAAENGGYRNYVKFANPT